MAQETVMIDFQVDYTELTNAQEQLAKTGKVDTAAFSKIQNAISETATDTQGLIKTFKDVGSASIKMGKSVEAAFGAGIQDALDEAGVSVKEFETALKKTVAPATSLKKELQQLKEAMARMKAEGKDTGKEFDALRSRAGKLSDAISDANAEIKNAGSDTKGLDNLVGSISAVAGGYAAVQGAAALFGDENEDLQKTLVKVNGAMAIASGLQQAFNALQKEGALIKLKDTIAIGGQTAAMKLYSFATGGASAATNVLRTALLATGVGAVVFLLYEGAKALNLFGSSSSDAADEQERLSRAIEDTNTAIEQQIENINITSTTNVKRARIAGQGEAAINKITRDAILERIKFYDTEGEARRLANNIPDQVEQGKLQIQIFKELNKAREDLRQFDLDLQVKSQEKAAEKQKEFLKKQADALKKARDEAAKQALDANDAGVLANLNRALKAVEAEQIAFDNSEDIRVADKEARDKNNADYAKGWKEMQESLTKSSETEIAKRKKLQDEERNNLIKTINTIVDVASRVASVFNEISALQTARDNEEIAAQRRKVDEQLKAGNITQKAAEARQKQIDQQERLAKQRAAERDKKAAVFSALIAVPKAFLQGLSTGGPVLGAIYAALAAVEAALIIARPVPKFFRGKKDSYAGPGVVGDMGSELVERDGRMFLYTKPTQTYLGARDKVYTAAETKRIIHNSNLSTTPVNRQGLGIDYNKMAAAMPKYSAPDINIDKEFISESVANGLQRVNYMDRRYSSRK